MGWKKSLSVLLSTLLIGSFCYGQNTTSLTGTITDSDGQAWVHAGWVATIVVPGGANAQFISGGAVPQTYSGELNSAGQFSSDVVGNTAAIIPAGVTWQFCFFSVTSAPKSCIGNVAVSGSTFAMGTYASARIAAPRFNALTLGYAYQVAEIQNPFRGSGYVNTITGDQFYFVNGSYSQVNGGGGGGSPTFDQIQSGENTSATMIVGNGATLELDTGGFIQANNANGYVMDWSLPIYTPGYVPTTDGAGNWLMEPLPFQSLTTTGSCPTAATLTGHVLNVPTCTPSGSGPTIQVNGTNNASQTVLNQINSTTNSVGLALTASNPTGGNTKYEITGAYSGGISSGQVTSALGYTPANCTPGTTGSDCLQLSSGLVPLANIPTDIPIGNIGSSGLSGTSPIQVSSTGAISCPTCGTSTGTVSQVNTSAPLSGGPITSTGTLTCTTCVIASSPGAGIGHFAGGTQNLTSSAVNLATSDVTGVLPINNGGLNSSVAPTTAQIPIAQSASSYAPKTMSGDCTIAATGAITCTATNGTSFTGYATTPYVANIQITVAGDGSNIISANSCSSVFTSTMTGLTATMTLQFTPSSDISGVTGFNPSTDGELYFIPWPTTNTLHYYLCNPTSSALGPSATTTWNVSAR